MNRYVFITDPANRGYAAQQITYYMYQYNRDVLKADVNEFHVNIVDNEEAAQKLVFDKDDVVLCFVYPGNAKRIPMTLFTVIMSVVGKMTAAGITVGDFQMLT